MPDRIAGIILAGGQSIRMGGGDKCLRLLDDRPILGAVIQRLHRQVDALALNANGDPARFSDFDLEIVPDKIPDLGPLSGILAGMKWAATKHSELTHILTMAADTPFFPENLRRQLGAAENGSGRVVLASSKKQIHPTCALWPISLATDLEKFLAREGAASVRAYAGKNQPPLIVDFPVTGDIDPFFNVNRPEDLVAAQEYVRRNRP